MKTTKGICIVLLLMLGFFTFGCGEISFGGSDDGSGSHLVVNPDSSVSQGNCRGGADCTGGPGCTIGPGCNGVINNNKTAIAVMGRMFHLPRNYQ